MPGKDRDEETGKYTVSYSDDDFLSAIRTLGDMTGTAGIAKEVGCTRRTAYTRLEALADQSRVERRQIGNSLVWIVNG